MNLNFLSKKPFEIQIMLKTQFKQKIVLPGTRSSLLCLNSISLLILELIVFCNGTWRDTSDSSFVGTQYMFFEITGCDNENAWKRTWKEFNFG